MVLDKKIQRVKLHFGVTTIDDWCDIKPEWILGLPDIGPSTLEHIRLYLSHRDVTLANDATPEYWRKHLGRARIGQSMTFGDFSVTNPFTVVIDSQEKQPFTFSGIVSERSQWSTDMAWLVKQQIAEPRDIKLIVPTEWRSLGNSHGDYSIDGHEGFCHVERKSQEDAHGTILGWGERRERFERELDFLANVECSAVVVECSLGRLIESAPSRGKKSASENRKILHRQVMAWQQDYRVPWLFCDSRRMAELSTFRILERYWKKRQQLSKSVARQTEIEVGEL